MYAQLEASKFITRDMPRITKRLTVVCQLHPVLLLQMHESHFSIFAYL